MPPRRCSNNTSIRAVSTQFTDADQQFGRRIRLGTALSWLQKRSSVPLIAFALHSCRGQSRPVGPSAESNARLALGVPRAMCIRKGRP